MSHVHEGALHAYLDGALDELPDGEARRVRMHLERCETCRQRLEHERAVRAEAEAILADARPSIDLPTLEELRLLAGSGGPAREERPHRPRLWRLGWAASVALAVGTGWMLRGTEPVGVRTGAQEGASAASPSAGAAARADRAEEPRVTAPARPPAAADGAARRMAEAVRPGAVAGEPSSPPSRAVTPPAATAPTEKSATELAAVPPSVAGGSAGAAPPDAGAGALLAEADRQAVPPLAEATAAAPVEVAERPEMDVASAARAPVEPGREAAAARPAGEAPAEEGGERRRGALGFRVTAEPVAPLLSGVDRPRADRLPFAREEERAPRARAADPGSLVVPGLEVLSIVWREEGVTPAGVRVLQRYSEDVVLELLHLPEGVDPASIEPPGAGVRELVVPRANGWLVLRAPLEPAVLEELLRRLDEPL